MRNFLNHIFNNFRTTKAWRMFMLCWTGFFSGYELFMTVFSQSHWFHFACLLLQATVFVIYFRAKTEVKLVDR